MKALLSLIAAVSLFTTATHAETIVEITVNTTANSQGGSFTFRLNPAGSILNTPDSNEWESDDAGALVSSISGTYITGNYTPDHIAALQTSGTGTNASLFLAISFTDLFYQGFAINMLEIDFYGDIPFTYGSSLTPTEYLASFAGTYPAYFIVPNSESGVSISFVTGSGVPGGVPVESMTITVIPEPGTMILTGLSGGLLLAYGARRRQRA